MAAAAADAPARGLSMSPGRRRGPPPPALALCPSPQDAPFQGGSPVWTPAPGRTCVVLDFDLTLAHCHVYKELRRKGFGAMPHELGRDRIFGGDERLAMLMSFLKRLRQQQCHVAVLTNNTEAAVGECLDLGGLTRLVDEVVTVDPLSTKGRDMRRLRPPGVTRWVFADDDCKNIRSVERETRNRVPCVHVDGGQGLQARHIAMIEAAVLPDFSAVVRSSTQTSSPPRGSFGEPSPEGNGSRTSGRPLSASSTHSRGSGPRDVGEEEGLGQTLHRAVSLVAMSPEDECVLSAAPGQRRQDTDSHHFTRHNTFISEAGKSATSESTEQSDQ